MESDNNRVDMFSSMVYCQECGTEASKSASYCESCGASLGTADDDAVEETVASRDSTSTDDSDATGTAEHGTATTGDDPEPGLDDRLEPKLRRLLWPDSWSHRLLGVVLSIVPALGAYLAVAVGLYATDIGWLFWILIPAFTYLTIQGDNWKEMTSVTLFWLAIESLITPVALLAYTLVFAGQQGTGLGAAGAGLGGLILVVVAFVVGLPLSGVFYLLSRRLSSG